MTRAQFKSRFGASPLVIGMIHLKPLPGSPAFGGDLEALVASAEADLRALQENGVGAVLIENFGDAPFYPDRVPVETVASMTAIVQHLRGHCRVPFGVNVLRNDGQAAVAIAAATGAAFVRINVLAGAVVADQGLISANAHEVLRLRRRLDAAISIFADVQVKHASPLGNFSLQDAASDLLERAHADALICTGSATGAAIDLGQLRLLREYLPDAVLLAGSGVDQNSARTILQDADGVIVGTALKKEGKVGNPVDVARVRQFMKRANGNF